MSDQLRGLLQEKGFETLFHGHPDAIYAVSVEGQLIDCNEALVAMTGYSRDELRAMTFEPLVEPSYLASTSENFLRAAQGETTRYVTRGRTRDGGSFFADVMNLPLRDHDGAVVGVLGIARDVSDLRRALDLADASQSISRIAGRIARIAGWTIDVPTGRLHWSDELFSILGVDGASVPLYADALVIFQDEPYRSDVARAVGECLSEGRPFDLQTKIRTVDGDILDVRLIGEAVRDEAGAVVRVDGALHDITSLVRQGEELREMERRVARTLNELSTPLAFVGRDWRISFVNRAGIALTGMTEEQLRAGTIWDVFPEALNNAFGDLYRRAMDEGTYGSATTYAATFHRYYEAVVYPTGDGIVITARDVTVEEEAKAALDEFNERVTFQAQMLDLAKDAMIVRDLQKGITFWNKSAEELYGWTLEEVRGRSTVDVLFRHPEDAVVPFEQLSKKGFWIGELEHTTRDGRQIFVDCRLQLIRNEKGEPLAIFGVNTDITASRREKERSIRAQRMESLGTLAGGIAHDLNNVLTPILMSVELLARDERDEPRLQLLASTEASVKRGADMIRQVLAFARGVEGEHERLSVAELLEEVEQFCRDTLPKNIDVDVETGECLRDVTGDSTQLMQVLINLITNARDAMPLGGRLVLRAYNTEFGDFEGDTAATSSPGVALEVSDTGEGIEPEVLARIFEPFYTTKDFGVGTGLGLSTSMAIVTGHGGRLEVETKRHAGTTFTVMLPAASLETSSAPPRGDAPSVDFDGKGRRVLVVDDEAPILLMLDEVLRAEGFEVDVAQNGDAALRTLDVATAPYDLIISDLNMPRLSGEEFASHARRHDAAVRFIFMSGVNARPGSRDASIDVGASFIQKPFSTVELLELIERTLA